MKSALLLFIPFVTLAQAPPAEAPAKIKTLIITGGLTTGHDWRTVTPLLRKALEDTGRFEVRVNEDFRGGGPETLAPYDLIVINYYDSRRPELRWGDRADNALLDAVRAGKGLVMYHFSTAAFDGWTEYEKMSGGNWRPNNGHHSPSHDFEVKVTDADHPITRGLRAKFRQPNDELYANLRWQPAGTYRVLATAWDDHKLYQGKAKQPTPGDGMDQPMLWTLEYGKGRVFGTALGHDGPAVQTPAFVATFVRGAEWAATGKVTLPVPPRMAAGVKYEDPQPRVVVPGAQAGAPPSDAVVLFDGTGVSKWSRKDGTPTGCKAVKGEMVCETGSGDAYTVEKLGSMQLHLEFLPPNMPDKKGQMKGNSGVYLQGITEVQVLDSYNNPTYATGVLGAIYDQHPPMVNAARPPSQWQSYDIVFNKPACNERGVQVKEGSMTVFLNGVLIQDKAPLRFHRGMCEDAPLMLQDHSGFPDAPHTVMTFRNIWYRPLP